MFAHPSQHETASRRSNSHFSPVAFINIFLLFALVISSCGPARQTTAVEAEAAEAEMMKTSEQPVNNYTPPVYEHPQPRIVERTDLEGQVASPRSKPGSSPSFTGSSSPFDRDAGYEAMRAEAMAEMEQASQEFESILPTSQGGGGVLPAPRRVDPSTIVNVTTPADANYGSPECQYRVEAPYTISGTFNDCDFYITGSGTVTISGTLIHTHVATDGRLVISGATLRDSHITNRYRMNYNSPLTISSSTITDSHVWSPNGSVSISGTVIADDSEVFTDHGTLTMTNSTVTNARVFIRVAGLLTVRDSTISEDSNIYGFSGPLVVSNSTFLTGSRISGGQGGEISKTSFSESRVGSGGALTITECTFSLASSVWNSGAMTITESNFTHSQASARDELTLMNSTFVDSLIDLLDTHIIHSEDALTIANSTIVGGYTGSGGSVKREQPPIPYTNSSSHSAILGSFISAYFTSGYPNPLEISSDSTLTSINNTLWGVSIDSATNLYLHNTILAHASTCGSDATAGTHNVIASSGSSACGLTNGEDDNIIGFDPKLSNLLMYGDYRAYFELKPNSPAIDAGDNSICAATPINNKSHNGVRRPIRAHCDIGSYEALWGVKDNETYSSCEDDGCISAVGGTFSTAGGPINTRTGSYDYNVEDLSIPTSAGALTFTRDYSSQALSQSTTLSPGWTHNHASRLIMPEDPGGEAGAILFKLHSANLFTFTIASDGTYQAAPGLLASLVRQAGPPVRFVVKDTQQTIYTFDEEGVLQSYEDARGNAWSYIYDTNGRLSQVSADGGSSLSLQYDSQGRIERVSDHTEDRFVTYHYDANGDLDSVIDLLNQTWIYEYSNHLMTRVAAPGNVTVERTEFYSDGRAWKQYDGEGNLVVELTYNADDTITLTDALRKTQTLTYDVRGTLIADANHLSQTSWKSYDPNFRPDSITTAYGSTTQLTWSEDGANLIKVVDASGNQTDITYDALNNPTSVVDALDHLTTYEYDGKLLTKSIDPLEGETTYTYTAEGFLASTTDPLGDTTSYTYNAHGQRTSMTDAQDNTWEYRYDEFDRLVDIVDPLKRVQHNVYDNAGRLIESTQNYDPKHPQNYQNQYNIVTKYEYDARGNQVSVTDTYDYKTQYVYDLANRLVQTIDAEQGTTTNIYNEAGQLVTTTDALGNPTHYGYDDAGRQTSVTDALGHTEYIDYNGDGTIYSQKDALERETSYDYDELQRLTYVYDPAGGMTENVYDALGNLIATTDPDGKTTRYEYDALGHLLIERDALGGVTENFYDAGGQLIQTIDPRENAVTYEYESGLLMSVTDDLGNKTRYEYDDLGRRTAVVDGEGGRTEYTYDALDRVIAVKDPLGHTIYTEYDARGQVLASTDANGNRTTFTYDKVGRLLSQTDPLDGVTSYTYDAMGNQRSMTDPNQHTRWTEYDVLNRPVLIKDALGNETHTTYDAAGQIITITDALGKPTRFGYDQLGRQTSITDPLEHITSFSYDAAGHLTKKTDANQIVTAYEYDDLGRLTAVIENSMPYEEPTVDTNVRTEFTYDENGNRLSITDGNGYATNFTYDDLNRLVSESDALQNTWTYEYDKLGNRVAMVDANGQRTEYRYDRAAQLTNVDYPGSDIDVAFEYDAGGRRTSMQDRMGRTTWTYDDLNRPTAITDPFGDEVGYAYDPAGNRTGLTYPNGSTVSYTYDAANRMTTVKNGSATVKYEYDPIGHLLAVLRPNGVDSAYTYDAAGQLTALQHAAEEKTLSSFNYVYDNVGNRKQAVEMIYDNPADPIVTVLAATSTGALLAGRTIYAFHNGVYTGYSQTTDANGEATFTLPQDRYRFRLDVDGTQFWSGSEDHCSIPFCADVVMTIPEPVLVTVQNTDGLPMPGLNVYAFDGSTYTGIHGTTNEDGQLSLRLPHGNYRFRADFNGTQFWSGSENHCTVVLCTMASVTVTLDVTVSVKDTDGAPREGIKVYAFNGSTYTGYSASTNANGQAIFTLPQGSYRFRADFNGTQFWSASANHCDIPGCRSADVTVTHGVLITVQDTDGLPKAGLKVYAFNGTTYTGYNGTTNEGGQVTFTLPLGSYRFRADFNGTQFWSGASNHCELPGCGSVAITVTNGIVLTVQDTDGLPKAGLKVYAFNGTTYTGYNGTTNESGQATFTLPIGSYRFRADLNGTQFWSGASNHCEIPGCGSAGITVTHGVVLTVQDTDGTPQANLKVYAFNGSTYTGYNGTTNESGQATFTLPLGSYRFRADLNGTQFWSGAANHCDIPGCGSASVTVSKPMLVTILDTDGVPKVGLNVYAFNGSTYTGYNKVTDANGQVVFTLPLGSYRFRADLNGTQFWSGVANHCDIPGCSEVQVTVTVPVTVTVLDTDGTPKAGLNVYAFNGSTYTGYSKVSDPNGQVVFTLPTGEYRFRADDSGTQYWSDSANYCSLPGCLTASVTVGPPAPTETLAPTEPPTLTPETPTETGYRASSHYARALQVSNNVTVTVLDTGSSPKEGLNVYVFDGANYTGHHGTTDASGHVTLSLPNGNYRFRADLDSTQFWSGTENHCSVPGCSAVEITVTLPVTVTVLDTDLLPKEGLHVYAFDGTTYTGYSKVTDASGQAAFTLPLGTYRFRSDLNGTQFWSGTENHCALPGCESAGITVTHPVSVHVLDWDDRPYAAGLPVYAFDGSTYTGYNATTDENGAVTFTLPSGSYHFRADLNGTQFWSSEENGCGVPGCTSVELSIPGWKDDYSATQTVDYTYDPLYRLTTAAYSYGNTLRYTYDEVGNRLSASDNWSGSSYQYDDANRLIRANGVPYTWDANGNLLNDGIRTYTYDPANRLASLSSQESMVNYAYNGLGDRLLQTHNGTTSLYTLDLNAGLTQILDDGTYSYLYGMDRIAQQRGNMAHYFLNDGLGSVRQLTDRNGIVTLATSYKPYGDGYLDGQTAYGFTGEYTDPSGLVYLRARYYDPATGRFLTRDTWDGDANQPMSFNRWNYVEGNPVNFTDPTGLIKQDEATDADIVVNRLKTYRVNIDVDWGGWSYQYYKDPLDITKPSVSCGWNEGEWELDELREIKRGVLDLSHAMGYNNFIFNIGYVDMVKDYIGNDVANTVIHLIKVNNSPFRVRISRFSTVHELAHAWDANTNGTTSSTFYIATAYNGKVHPSSPCDADKKLPGCNTAGYVYVDVLAYGLKYDNFNIKEDFANSVMVYVYPELQRRIRKYDVPKYRDYLYYADYRTTLRWSIIDALIKSTNKYRPR